ncbi:hypothetical protein KFZ36_26490, partial [Salmonella enterica subsp. enterica serovar Typhimurium]|nr:hypothetical protein [Salmonella enterica subsp. enterica serovar Typhimurium]
FVSLYLVLLVCYKKTQKDFALFACFLLFLFPNSKTPKIFAVLLWFVKFIMSSMVFGGWSVVFILYYPSYTSERQ